MEKIQVFLDTDVIIAALLSKTGASYEIIRNPKVQKVITSSIKKEVVEVVKRLNIKKTDSNKLLKKAKVVDSNIKSSEILIKYQVFVSEEEDAHVVAGSHLANTRFLLTHNIKHYSIEMIKNHLDIIVLKPGNFLQYLRSLTS